MIRYALVCLNEHEFESWFRDSAAFESLSGADAVTCPHCGSSGVRKALMAPSVVTSRKKAVPKTAPVLETPATASVPVPSAPPAVLLDERERGLREMLRSLHREVIAKADNVGRDFAREARRIHEGDAPQQRSIYGEASKGEVEALLEDGVPLLPMPTLPDDHN